MIQADFNFRCTMDNYLDHTVYIGPTGDDEMCNFYLLYWVKGRKLPRKNLCWSVGPPRYSWAGKSAFHEGLTNIPNDVA